MQCRRKCLFTGVACAEAAIALTVVGGRDDVNAGPLADLPSEDDVHAVALSVRAVGRRLVQVSTVADHMHVGCEDTQQLGWGNKSSGGREQGRTRAWVIPESSRP